MSEVELAEKLLDDVDEEMADEAADKDADKEADEAEKEKIKEAKERVGKLKSALNSLKEIEWGKVVKDFVKFVIKNLAVGAILWGVMVALNKIISKSSGTEKTTNQKKQKKIQALAQLISDISTYIKDLSDWMQAKEDVTVDAGSGIMVPLPDVYTKYTKPMQTHIDTIYNVAKELWPDSGSGKTTAVVPTIDQVDKIVTNTGPVVDGLQDIVTFTNANKKKFSDLSTMPIKQYNVDTLNGDLETVKALPYA